MITSIQPTNYQRYNIPHYRCNNSPQFKGLEVVAEKSVRSVEFPARKLANRIFDFFSTNKHDDVCREFIATDVDSSDYIRRLIKIGRIFVPKKDVEINLDSGRIDKIAKSGKPHIFVMNHGDQYRDPQMLSAFNTILNTKYLENGVAETCPRTRIILNEDIVKAMSPLNRDVFMKFGAVPIDASLYSADKGKNTRQFVPLLRDFIRGKVNIFIFPEGRKAILRGPLEEKFQLGSAEMVTKLVDKMPEVNVTPVSFAYGKTRKHGGHSIYVGETITFKKEGAGISASVGNLDSKYADSDYQKFFEGKQNAVLTENGCPVELKDSAAYVGGVICENMKVCMEYAKENLPLKNPLADVLVI